MSSFGLPAITPIKRAPFGAVNRPDAPAAVAASAAGKRAAESNPQCWPNKKTKTAAALAPPPGLQFLTVFKCKYYGSSELGAGESCQVTTGQCTELVRRVVAANGRKHTPAVLHVTDVGVQLQTRKQAAPELALDVEQIRNIVPGTIKCKSGKTFRVALIIERDAAGDFGTDDAAAYHVVQFRHQDDLRCLAESTKRMWRDHMFTALLDVSTEEGQSHFDALSIERDIEAVNSRCSKLVEHEAFEFEAALEGLLQQQ